MLHERVRCRTRRRRLPRASALVLAGSLMGGDIERAVRHVREQGHPVVSLTMAGSVPQAADHVVTDPVQAGVMTVMGVASTAKFDVSQLSRRTFRQRHCNAALPPLLPFPHLSPQQTYAEARLPRSRRPWLLPAVLILLLSGDARAQIPEMGGINFHGFLFGDVTYVATERDVLDGFLIGQLVGHGNAELSQRLSLFGELSATARETGYNIEVERIILRYDFIDALKLSVGRYHTPNSYWNTAYHHGLWLQTSVARPELIKVGGTFLPVHFVGAMAEGDIALPGVTLAYNGGVGNGRGVVVTRGGDAGDVNGSRAAVVTASVRPSLFGLTLGGSMYFDDIETTAGQIDERTASAHVVWSQGIPELVAEYVHVQHEQDFGTQTETTSTGYYIHGGVKLGSFKPYARYEEMRIDSDDVLFAATVRDYRAQLLGVRWDFEGLAALKAEVRREHIAAEEGQNSLLVQLTFVLPSFVGM